MPDNHTMIGRTLAWISVVIGAVLVQISVLVSTIQGVEADLTQTDGTPPAWLPLMLLVGLALLAVAAVLFHRHRHRCWR